MQKRIIRILSSIIIMSIAVIWLSFGDLIYAGSQITASKNNTDAWTSSDTWNLSWNYTAYLNPVTDVNWNITTPNSTILRSITWSINSTLYWDFKISSLNAIYNASKFNAFTTDCPSWWVLMLNWTISSAIWWNFNVDSNSHLCVVWGKIVIKLNSLKIWEKDLWGGWIATTTAISQTVKVNWINKIQTDSIISPVSSIQWQFEDQKYIIRTNINKQLGLLLNWMQGEKVKTKLTKSEFEDTSWGMKYFNYEWQKELIPSNEDNMWKILKLENSYSFSAPSNYKLKVVGQKTIIVKWGNIYINADIYNSNDSDSLLVLVAKRWDWAEYENGWNIYIDPSVTNIDAVLIADWSVLDYNGTSTIDSSANAASKNSLRRQLMIFWQVSSSNTTWSDTAPYWSDAYIKYGKSYSDNRYDISKLRTFEVIPVPSGLTCWDNNAPRRNDSMEGLEYAWAGKKLCKVWDSPENWLRVSNLENPVIVMYNSNIQILKPYIMQISE
ncbi:MAG: hypothetical protein ACD_2C00208G0009 [uncultured bacterium (gcode 4)]|uniref:Uncharacterized protein n=1 Tax=uncultured bacterium (gcode 4) TaxID=1234023 RepID=K2G1Z0_9BACT|nr:MAG: hypothetical protein ACD_2C00208G0009 [uncultured bacterium (gcode 4)]